MTVRKVYRIFDIARKESSSPYIRFDPHPMAANYEHAGIIDPGEAFRTLEKSNKEILSKTGGPRFELHIHEEDV